MEDLSGYLAVISCSRFTLSWHQQPRLTNIVAYSGELSKSPVRVRVAAILLVSFGMLMMGYASRSCPCWGRLLIGYFLEFLAATLKSLEK